MESTNLVFNLNISTLNLIVENLKEFVKIIDEPKIDNLRKEKLIEETTKLINLLIKLQIKEANCENLRKKFKLFHLLNSNFIQLSLEIDQENRIKIIICLIKNRDFLNLKSIESNDREIILKESKQLIEFLINLPNQNIEIDLTKDLTDDDLNLTLSKNNSETYLSKFDLSCELIDKENNLSNKDKKIKKSYKSNRNNKLSIDEKSLSTKSFNQMLNSNNETNQLNSTINEIKKSSNLKTYETKFTFDLNNIKDFLKEVDAVFYSDEFMLADIPWFVEVHSSPNSKSSRRDYKYLTIGLSRAESKNEIGWYCSTDFTIRILNHVDDDDDKFEKFQDQIFKAGKWLRGFYENKFICYKDLDNGFILDDKITITIDLKLEKQELL